MSTSEQSVTTPVARGILAAGVSLATGLALAVIPALAAQVAGTRSTATALDAILIGLNILVLGHGGGITLSTGAIEGTVTLAPFGLTGLLILVSALGMRRVGRLLELVRPDGLLRSSALRDAGSALAAHTVLYALGMAVLAAIARSADVSPVIPSAVFSAALISLLGGLCGLLWSLRREATDEVPGVRVLSLLPSPFDAVARAVCIAVVGVLGTGMLLLIVMLLLSLPEQAGLFAQLDPGPVGGLVLTLLQLALLPLLAVWASTVLLGGTVTLGTGTSVSLAGAETGVLPALPVLGALPQPGTAPAWTVLLLVLPLGVVMLGAHRLVRDVQELPLRDRITAWITYPLVVLVALLLIAGLSTGGIGDSRLAHLGPTMPTVLLPSAILVLGGTGLIVGIFASGLIPWAGRAIAALRSRVENAERAEQEERARGAGPADAADTTDDADAVDGPDGKDGTDDADAADEIDLWARGADDDVDGGDAADESSAEAEVSPRADR